MLLSSDSASLVVVVCEAAEEDVVDRVPPVRAPGVEVMELKELRDIASDSSGRDAASAPRSRDPHPVPK